MGIQRRYWLYFLQDAPTSLCYYIDSMGNIQKGNVLLGDDLSLPQSPGGWNEIQLSFGRSMHYWGLNRTFTIPLKFIGDGAKIIRHLFYTGRGIESPVNLVICKWDDVTGVFRLYYSGQLDLTKIEDEVAEGVKVNIMQGGIVQALKAYENTVFEIPCDGSIPENIKVNCDGILLNDVFHYQILNLQVPFSGELPLPCAFLNNDGDNIGITRNNPQLEQPGTGYFQKSTNFLFSSEEPITVRIQGNITILPDWRVSNTAFYMFLATSLSQPRAGGIDHAAGLIKPYHPASTIWEALNSQLNVVGQTQFTFDATMNLSAKENLFLMFFNDFAATPITIIGGSFSLTFSSRYRASRVWGIRPYDLGKLIIQEMNALSSNFVQIFNYIFDSMLLQNNPNLVVTSGDALRASTDPNYFQYYNQATLNPVNPNNQFYNQFASQGPVIKTTISDFFDSFNAILNAALSNQQLPGEQESMFIESKNYVMDPSVITMTLTKIANFRVNIALDYFFNWLKVGYNPQQYDEKAGKYEYNTLVQWQAPIKTLSKILELICKYRADSYGIEYTRYNTQGGKSSTFNNSDNSVFLLNTDFSTSIPDFYNAYFISAVPLASSVTNTDQKLTLNQSYLPIYLDTLDGEYFTALNDFSIFMFNQPAPGTRSISVTTPTPALLNGLIGDSATINFYINGVLIQSWTQAVTGVNTPFNISYTSSRTFLKSDNLYFTISTVRTCTVEITDFLVNIGAGYWSAETSGPINIQAGSTQQTISLPVIVATMITIGGLQIPVVSSGFQYFTFLSNVHNKNFNWSFGISVYHQGGSSETMTFDVWKNGVNIGTLQFHGNSNILTLFNPPVITGGLSLPPANFTGNITFSLYDIVWITGSDTNINTFVTNAQLEFTSTGVDAFELLRLAYSNVSGIPNPQSAFNIEQLTPKRMLNTSSNLLSPVLFNQAPGSLIHQTSDKNQFLATTLGGISTIENANVDIHDLDAPLFYPLLFEFDTEVPINFADLFNNAANGHIEFIYNGISFFGFPIQVTSKPAFNESQTWKLLCSPKTNLSDLVNLDWTGLQQLMPLDISIPIISPVHFVPLGFIKPDVYKNNTMDQDLYRNRILQWIDTNDYTAPRQADEPIPFQCQSGSLSPASVQVLNSLGQNVGTAINIPSITDPSVNVPQLLFQGIIPLNTLADGIYYFVLSVGTGPAIGQFISEGIQIKTNWDATTIRIDYKNSTNKLASVFTSGWWPNIRVHGQINRYTPKSKFTTFIDQPQDIDLLNAIPYDTWRLEIGRSSGIPDYMMRKIARIFDLDTVMIDGDQYTRDGDAQWEKQNFPGQPKEYLSLDIRRAKNIDAITMNTAGQITSDMPAGYVLDPQAFGLGPTQPMIQVDGS